MTPFGTPDPSRLLKDESEMRSEILTAFRKIAARPESSSRIHRAIARHGELYSEWNADQKKQEEWREHAIEALKKRQDPKPSTPEEVPLFNARPTDLVWSTLSREDRFAIAVDALVGFAASEHVEWVKPFVPLDSIRQWVLEVSSKNLNVGNAKTYLLLVSEFLADQPNPTISSAHAPNITRYAVEPTAVTARQKIAEWVFEGSLKPDKRAVFQKCVRTVIASDPGPNATNRPMAAKGAELAALDEKARVEVAAARLVTMHDMESPASAIVSDSFDGASCSLAALVGPVLYPDADALEDQKILRAHLAMLPRKAQSDDRNPPAPNAGGEKAIDENDTAAALPTMRDLASAAGISDDTFGRVRDAAGIGVKSTGAAARNRRYTPSEVHRLITAALAGNFIERQGMAEKWRRWGRPKGRE